MIVIVRPGCWATAPEDDNAMAAIAVSTNRRERVPSKRLLSDPPIVGALCRAALVVAFRDLGQHEAYRQALLRPPPTFPANPRALTREEPRAEQAQAGLAWI